MAILRIFGFKKILVPAHKKNEDLKQVLSMYVESISREYDTDLCNDGENTFRYHFIHHPGVWSYMGSKRCAWSENNFDIELKTSNGNNSDRMELRTYSLYLDYKNNEEYKNDRDGWRIGLWAKGKSCFYLERDFEIENVNKKIAIDVYFYNDNGNREKEDSYSFDLFVRSSHPYPENNEEKLIFAEEDYQNNKKFFSNIVSDKMNTLIRKADGRLHSNTLFSRSQIKLQLKEIMQEINQHFKSYERD